MARIPFILVALALFAPRLQAQAERNVVLLMWDGVRRDEFLGKVDPSLLPKTEANRQRTLFPYLWGQLAPNGSLFGDPRDNRAMTVANPSIVSLPAYQSIFAGFTTPCTGNGCGRIKAGTFAERLVGDGFDPQDVATIASWAKIALAVEHKEGTTFVNAGLVPLVDGEADAELDALNRAQQADPPPWGDARRDVYTHEHALRYLTRHKPRFLFVSLNDSDEWGHAGNYPAYLDALDRYDLWLAELVATLGQLGDYGKRTCVVITTDHGRGLGDNWTRHSNGDPYSGLILMYAGCPLDPGASPFVRSPLLTSHLDVRPTIEQLLGLSPKVCVGCGHSLVKPADALAH